MKEFKYVITDCDGIHARPAGELVKLAKGFNSEIKVYKDGQSADAKKIFAIMGLAVKQGQEILISISGEDEENAAKEVENFLKQAL